MKILRKMISVENPCGKNVSKFQVHICCRYKVINHRECAFLPFSNIYSCFASGQKLCCDKRNKGITAWRWTLRSDCTLDGIKSIFVLIVHEYWWVALIYYLWLTGSLWLTGCAFDLIITIVNWNSCIASKIMMALFKRENP